MFLRVAMVILCFSLSLQATAEAPKHYALSDYILTSDEVRKLNADEQEIYFNFLIYLTGVVETAGGQKTNKQASLGFDFRRLLHEAFDNEAHALGPLVVIPILGGIGGRALIAAAPRALPVMARYWSTFRAAASGAAEKATLLITEEAAKRAALKKAVLWSTVAATATDGAHRLAGGGSAEAESPQPTGRQDFTAPPEAAAAATAPMKGSSKVATVTIGKGGKVKTAAQGGVHETELSDYIKADNICLFGGRASVYKAMADGSILCTQPKDNSGGKCRGTAEAPNYQCENFGLLQAPDSEAVAKSLCIPLYSENGLTDLSARCVAVAGKWLKDNPPTKMDPAQWAQFAEKMKKYLSEYEGQRKANEVTLAAYCEGGNKLNAGKQQPECAAVFGLIGELKKYTSVEKLIVARNAPLPASAPSAPAKGSSAPGGQ